MPEKIEIPAFYIQKLLAGSLKTAETVYAGLADLLDKDETPLNPFWGQILNIREKVFAAYLWRSARLASGGPSAIRGYMARDRPAIDMLSRGFPHYDYCASHMKRLDNERKISGKDALFFEYLDDILNPFEETTRANRMRNVPEEEFHLVLGKLCWPVLLDYVAQDAYDQITREFTADTPFRQKARPIPGVRMYKGDPVDRVARQDHEVQTYTTLCENIASLLNKYPPRITRADLAQRDLSDAERGGVYDDDTREIVVPQEYRTTPSAGGQTATTPQEPREQTRLTLRSQGNALSRKHTQKMFDFGPSPPENRYSDPEDFGRNTYGKRKR